MRWMLSVWVAVALLALCRGYSTGFEGYRLSMSGYRLCTRNETRLVSVLVTHRIPYTVTRPCGGWLLWKTCEATLYRTTHQTEYKTVTQEVTRCCDGYVQVGSYCALPLNRSREFTARPGSCSSADGLPPSYEDCEWDIDCPGCQKCCQKSSISLCTDAATYYSENGGWRFNVTVTVKTDYQQLMSMDRGLLNHTRVLHAMVTGALDSPNVSVQYLSSGPVHPFRTATSLLIDSDFPLSLSNATSKLHLLLKHIGEVSSVTVEDVDECAHTGLRKCSPQAECNNTVGSYLCTCRQGYIDVDPSNTGAHCQADPRGTTTTEPPAPCNMVTMPTSTSPPPMNTTRTPTTNTTQHPATGNSTMGIFNSSETSMPTVLNTTSSGHSYSSYAPQLQTSAAPYTSMGSTVDVQTTTCAPPHLTSLQSANVTGNSFCAYWSCQFQTNQTYLVVLSQGSEVIRAWETNQTMSEVTGLQPGVLYNVTVTPCACGRQGDALQMSVKTAAQTLDATARLTNVQFTADLLNSSSQAYLNLTQSIKQEIYQSLSSEIKAMVASGQVRIKINSLSQGSVVVNFTIISTPNNDVNQPINNVSSALLSSLKNSSKYTVDENSTSINDFDECASGENDCSQWATCTNIWASYECICMEGFTDNNPARPGRACQATAPSITTTTPATTTSPTTTTSAPTTTTTAPSATTTTSATTSTAPTTTTTTPTTTTAPTTTTIAPTTTTIAPATTSTTSEVTPGTISVRCRAIAITVTVARDFLVSKQISDGALYLGLEECGINGGNATHAQLTVAWDECDTKLLHNETYYTAQVTLFNTMDPHRLPNGIVEVPKIQLQVPIMCTYRKSILISTGFGSMGYEMIKDTIMGSGSFHVTVKLMNGTAPLPQNYSLSPEDDVVVEVSLNTSAQQIKVVINKCWATPSINPTASDSYTFLEYSCPLPNTHTTVLQNGNSSTSRLSVRIFSFVNLDVIYLHCQVQICVQMGSATCVPDCTERTARLSNTIGRAYGFSGPLLRSDYESLEEGFDTLHLVGFCCLGVGLALLFLGGFICLFYCQRNRIGHYNFSLKPKEENFTYLVFNT
uniref:uromodulin-like 1 n=1 Tax=Centroberyx gerrardi TaxID=166262 RepID=UPI003AABF7DC